MSGDIYNISLNSQSRLNFTDSYDPTRTMSIRPAESIPYKELNINRYATKKTIAQGMLDIALLTANASQLRYILSLGDSHQFYGVMLGFIIMSLILQLVIGALSLSLSLLRDCCLEDEGYNRSAHGINQFNLVAVFIITIINILISAFETFNAPIRAGK